MFVKFTIAPPALEHSLAHNFTSANPGKSIRPYPSLFGYGFFGGWFVGPLGLTGALTELRFGCGGSGGGWQRRRRKRRRRRARLLPSSLLFSPPKCSVCTPPLFPPNQPCRHAPRAKERNAIPFPPSPLTEQQVH